MPPTIMPSSSASAASSAVAAPTSQIGDTLNKAWKNDKTKFGLKMLQKMGWTEGKGLGKYEDGVSEHVKVAKKSNNLGLGATHDTTGAAGWASTATSFNGVLEALGKAYNTPGTKSNGKGKKDRGEKKKIKSKDRKRRKAGGSEVDQADDSTGEGDAAGVTSSNGAGKAASSCPSRARRVRSKDVKNFSSADLRAILGQAATDVNPSLPSYPTIGGIRNNAEETMGETKTKKSKVRKKRGREESDISINSSRRRSGVDDYDIVVGGAPSKSRPSPIRRRPRTRSMDLEAPTLPVSNSDMTESKDDVDQDKSGSVKASYTTEAMADQENETSSNRTSSRKSKKKKKDGRTRNGDASEALSSAGGGGESEKAVAEVEVAPSMAAIAAAEKSEKKRRKKSKGK